MRFQDLLLQRSCELPAEDFDALVKDLGNAKSYMTQILIQKCAFWEQLPWKLCGLASPNPHAAREVATAALAQFDASPHVRDLHHPVAWRFLSKDGELRECVQKLAAGVPLAELAPLRFEVAALAFTPVVERVIERQHATVHKQISGRTAGGAYVSCSLRLPETERLIRTNQKNYIAFLGCLQSARRLREVVRDLGLSQHPKVKEAMPVGQRPKTSCVRRVLATVLYGLDAESQFASHAAARSHGQAAKLRISRLATALLPPKCRNKLGIDAILDFAAADFFRKKAPLGQIFALPASLGVAVLGDRLASQCSQSQSARGPSQQDNARVLEADCEEVAEQPAASPGLLCFKVLSTTAGAAKVIAPAPAAGTKLNQDAVTATLHVCSGGDLDSGMPVAALEPLTGPGISPVAVLSLNEIVKHRDLLQVFKQRQALVYTVGSHGAGTPVAHLVTDMVRCGAMQGSAEVFTVTDRSSQQVQQLEELRVDGLVTCTSAESGGSSWQLTEKALGHLQSHVELHTPRQFFHVRGDLPLAGRMPFELLTIMEKQGWQWQRLQKGRAPAYVRGGQRVFYSSGLTVGPFYLTALLSSEDLEAKGVHAIQHGLPESDYKRLILGHRAPNPAEALEPDAEAEVFEPIAEEASRSGVARARARNPNLEAAGGRRVKQQSAAQLGAFLAAEQDEPAEVEDDEARVDSNMEPTDDPEDGPLERALAELLDTAGLLDLASADPEPAASCEPPSAEVAARPAFVEAVQEETALNIDSGQPAQVRF